MEFIMTTLLLISWVALIFMSYKGSVLLLDKMNLL
jgi:hypothetical protein